MTTPTQESHSENATHSPTVIPAGDVVILREAELDTDLASAIERVRANSETSRSRILIVGPNQGEEQAEAASTTLPLPAMPVSTPQFSRLREGAVLERLGARLESLLDCLDVLSDEVSETVSELGESAVEAPRAHIQSGVRRIGEILTWSTEVAKELRLESERAQSGIRECAVPEFLDEVSRQVESYFPSLRVHSVGSDAVPTVAARSAELAELFFHGIVLTAHRIGGSGSIQLSQQADGEFLVVSVLGFGEPQGIDAPDTIQHFRELVTGHGGSVTPAAHGAGGTGVEIRLPLASKA